MKFSKLWLDELTGADIETEQLSEQLTMVGLEVAEIRSVADKFTGVVVGKVLHVDRHPNADKLTICQIDVGGPDNLSIVCGAKNVRVGIKVPVALVGAELPNDFKIKPAKLRGVESAGMLCSATELGLPAAEASAGLLELSNDAPIGMDIRQYLTLDDSVVEIELTSNRGDCLSMLGIAREVAAINRFKLPHIELADFNTSADLFPVTITAADGCPRYCGRIICGINNDVCTPVWMRERLCRSGVRSVNPVVDITNYVMLEMGQPLHVFDLAKIGREIEVRYANGGERLVLLDGREVELATETMVVASDNGVLAIAGVMGGSNSGVSTTTTDIFLESAFFVPEKVAGVARSYNLQTDSAYRFERGVDWQMQAKALERATSLIIEIVGGVPGGVVEVASSSNLPRTAEILLRRDSIKNILGFHIPDEEVQSILVHLGLEVEPDVDGDGWQVKSPSWRHDLKIEEDLVEEVARIFGYDRIPEENIVAELGVKKSLIAVELEERARLYALMEDLGYHEAITYSFVDEKLQSLFGMHEKVLSLANPISSEMSVMRATLWPGLIGAVRYNIQRQQQRVRLFETGLCFTKQDDLLEQRLMIAGIAYGDLCPEQWGAKQSEQVGYFELKNDVAAILKMFVDENSVEYAPASLEALHPLRSAQINVHGQLVGYFGEIHPALRQKLELTRNVCLFELDLAILGNKLIRPKKVFKRFSKFPKVQRDLSIIVDKEISWREIRQKIVDISGELLHNVALFDVYCNENIGLDKRSMAIRLTFQRMDRTLVDEEIEQLVSGIVLVLEQTFRASLRG